MTRLSKLLQNILILNLICLIISLTQDQFQIEVKILNITKEKLMMNSRISGGIFILLEGIIELQK